MRLGIFSALSRLRAMLALFRKEKQIMDLFSEITGSVTEGLKKEVGSSVDTKVNKIVKDIRDMHR